VGGGLTEEEGGQPRAGGMGGCMGHPPFWLTLPLSSSPKGARRGWGACLLALRGSAGVGGWLRIEGEGVEPLVVVWRGFGGERKSAVDAARDSNWSEYTARKRCVSGVGVWVEEQRWRVSYRGGGLRCNVWAAAGMKEASWHRVGSLGHLRTWEVRSLSGAARGRGGRGELGV